VICAAACPTLPEFFEQVYLPCRLVGCSADTIEQYRLAVKHWASVHPNLPIASIDALTVAKFQAAMIVGRSPASVNAYTRPVKAILRLSADQDNRLIERPPAVKMIPERRRPPLAITIDELTKIMVYVSTLAGSIAGYRRADWWRAVLLTAWETGLRLKQLMRLRTVDLLWEDCGIFSQAEDAKDREGDWFPLQTRTLDAVRVVYDQSRETLFPSAYAPSTAGKHLRSILDQSGIYAPRGSGMAFHRLRRSKASYTELAGGDAQRVMGHSARSVTERYLDPRIVGRAKQPPMPMPAI